MGSGLVREDSGCAGSGGEVSVKCRRQRRLEGALYSARGAQTSETRVTNVLNTQGRGGECYARRARRQSRKGRGRTTSVPTGGASANHAREEGICLS
eukprot:4785029-Pyramimonas_sp.AAC.1